MAGAARRLLEENLNLRVELREARIKADYYRRMMLKALDTIRKGDKTP